MTFNDDDFEVVVQDRRGLKFVQVTHLETGLRYTELCSNSVVDLFIANFKERIESSINALYHYESVDESGKFVSVYVSKRCYDIGVGKSSTSRQEANRLAMEDFYAQDEPNGTLVNLTMMASSLVKSHRDIGAIMRSLVSEVGELSQEVDVKLGTTYKKADVDGILGEAIDAMLCTLDLIKVTYPNITEKEICDVAIKKIDKWLTLTGSK